MKLCVVMISFLAFCACTLKSVKHHDDFGRAWEPILEVLNTDVTLSLNESYDISTDLLKGYQDDLRTYQSQWKTIDTTTSSVAERRTRENKFFAEQFRTQNGELEKRIAAYAKNIGGEVPDRQELIVSLTNQMEQNKVSSTAAVADFDDGSQIGFCFGRALLAHYLLLKSGVPQEDMLKIFALGDLWVNYQMWNFHMALMIRDPKHGYVVIDPLQKTALPYHDWMAETQKFSIKYPNARIRFYVTDPRKFVPALGAYSVDVLSDPVLEEYFSKLGHEIHNSFSVLVQKN